MSKERFAEEFKLEAVRQVVERGCTVADVSKRFGVSVQSLYKWVISRILFNIVRKAMNHYNSLNFNNPIKLLAIFTFCFMFVACSSEPQNPIIGEWRNSVEMYRFHPDGTLDQETFDNPYFEPPPGYEQTHKGRWKVDGNGLLITYSLEKDAQWQHLSLNYLDSNTLEMSVTQSTGDTHKFPTYIRTDEKQVAHSEVKSFSDKLANVFSTNSGGFGTLRGAVETSFSLLANAEFSEFCNHLSKRALVETNAYVPGSNATCEKVLPLMLSVREHTSIMDFPEGWKITETDMPDETALREQNEIFIWTSLPSKYRSKEKNYYVLFENGQEKPNYLQFKLIDGEWKIHKI